MNAGIAEMSFARVPLCLIDHSLSHLIPIVVTNKNNNKNRGFSGLFEVQRFDPMGVFFAGRNPKFLHLNMAFDCHTMWHTFSVFRGLRIES